MLLLVAVAMRLSGDKGPFLYRAPRVGQGETFTVLKVRTMTPGSAGSKVTLANDPRVTRMGRMLRRYRLDELPQLINVIRGEMSLVGPRPEDPAYVDLADPLHRRVFSAKPGITGLAQLEYHDEADLLAGPDADRALPPGDPAREAQARRRVPGPPHDTPRSQDSCVDRSHHRALKLHPFRADPNVAPRAQRFSLRYSVDKAADPALPWSHDREAPDGSLTGPEQGGHDSGHAE